ncbi:hypothetical protein [Mucilaginibacter dorajii]|uniref:YcxB-like protein domain-containing protein n=1 Tax=Mucilaginibacter dorajii TaxID=692994 RepID=A0ABP7PKW5_9SPHI|nr:hypothetical protein [Mucilaginibacter dorajii]MCS3733621.1 hypothetical protein [Mucilaginibacter dorajii]
MFEKIDFKRSIASLKIKWEDNGFLNRYSGLIMFPLISIVVAIAFVLTSINIISILSFLGAVVFLIIWIYYTRSNDKLIIVNFQGSTTDLRKLIEFELKQTGWQVFRSNAQFITAHKAGSWLVGSKMAVLFHKDSIFINAQNQDGFRGYFPFSFGRNKKLTNQLVILINSIQPNLTQSTTL